MIFVHEDGEFGDLLRITAEAKGISVALVEKDYWVVHSLWALHEVGLDVWFKGGTSLSKGFGLIERFSEDLDLKIEPGRVQSVPFVENWKSDGVKAAAARQTYFERLLATLHIPGATVTLGDRHDTWKSANFHVTYPGKHLASLDSVLKPFVLLEVGSARVSPAVGRSMASFVHDHLEHQGLLAEFIDNRPKVVRCVNPLVTLIEKLDAIARRHSRDDVDPALFVRHYEDAANIIRAAPSLAPLEGYDGIRSLVEEMSSHRQIAGPPNASGAAFLPEDSARWAAVRKAHADIAPMFWGPRRSLDEACELIRGWLASELP